MTGAQDSFLDQPARAFLDQLAARTPAPGGGGAAAVAGAMAAALVAMAARFSGARLPDAGDLAAQADELRRRAAGLADLDARAYQSVLGTRGPQRREALQAAADARDAADRVTTVNSGTERARTEP